MLEPRQMTEKGLASLMRWVPALRRLNTRTGQMVAGIARSEDVAGFAPNNPLVWIVEPNVGGLFQQTEKMLGKGNGGRWTELRAANIPVDADGKPRTSSQLTNGLQPGWRLNVPPSWFPQSSAPPIGGAPPTVQPPIQGLPGSTALGYKYRVLDGDNPSQIAKKLVLNASRWSELVAANPQKPRDGGGGGDVPPIAIIPEWNFDAGEVGNFKTLYPNELLLLPDLWIPEMVTYQTIGYAIAPTAPGWTPPKGGNVIPIIPPAELPPGYVPPVIPVIPGAPPVSPPLAFGTYTQMQAQLAAWGRWSGKIAPSDFGLVATDFTGVADARSVSALASYQRWANSMKGESLRTDGQLDEPTQASLAATVAGILTTAPPTTPAETSSNTPIIVAGGALALGIGYLLLRKKKK